MLLPNSLPRLNQDHVVVCVDDDPPILSSLRRLLRNEPYQFLITEAPDEAMNWILQKQASIVIADQRMPLMTGLDLLELVRACSPSTIRVMLTGHSELTEVMKLKKIDAIQKLLRKPWDGDELKYTLRELLLQKERQGRRDASPKDHGN
jgi:DNA-binding NtrC family response regulator